MTARAAQVTRYAGWSLTGVIAIEVAALAVMTIAASLAGERADWLTYVRGAEAVLSGQSPYASFQLAGPYLLTEAAGGHGYVYPPSAAVVMAPVLRPYILWTSLNVGVFVAGVLAVLTVHRRLQRLPVSLVLAVAVLSPPLWDAVQGGAVTPLLAGALGLVYAGMPLAGLAAAVKLFPATWIVLTRTREAIAWSVGGIGLPVAASLVLVGFEPWTQYVHVFRNALPACGSFLPGLSCLGAPAWLGLVAAGSLSVGALALPRPWALLAVGSVPIAYSGQLPLHYFLMLVPPAVAIACESLRPRRYQATSEQS